MSSHATASPGPLSSRLVWRFQRGECECFFLWKPQKETHGEKKKKASPAKHGRVESQLWDLGHPPGFAEVEGLARGRSCRGRTDTTIASQVFGLLSCGVEASSLRQVLPNAEKTPQTLASVISLWYLSRFPERKETHSFSLFTHSISGLAPSLIPCFSSDPNHVRHHYWPKRRTCHPQVVQGGKQENPQFLRVPVCISM